MKSPFTKPFGKGTKLDDKKAALDRKMKLLERIKHRPASPTKSVSPASTELTASVSSVTIPVSPMVAPDVEKVGKARIPFYRDDEAAPAALSPALTTLVNMYLRAARLRTRHIAMLWPVAPRALSVVHAIATIERWGHGDKRGVRGLIAPVKANAFYPLNHLQVDPECLIDLANRFYEVGQKNPAVVRTDENRDVFLFSINSLRKDVQDNFKPTLGELLPHFLAKVDKEMWPSCRDKLLAQTRAKLSARSHAKGLDANILSLYGMAATAPDAQFGLDMRMERDARKRALRQLKAAGRPEVLLIDATRRVRFGFRNWSRHLAAFMVDVEEVMGEGRPGIVVVIDDAQAAFQLRQQLEVVNKEREPERRWRMQSDFHIEGICNGLRDDGLLPPGVETLPVPVPKEFDVSIVDTDAAKVVAQLYKIGRTIPGGMNAAGPVIEAAKYLTRLSALPCGMQDIETWLMEWNAEDRDRRTYSWSVCEMAARQFALSEEVGREREHLEKALDIGSALFVNYRQATPFARRLTEMVLAEARGKGCAVVFSSARHRQLAERYWERVGLSGGVSYASVKHKIDMLMSLKLEESLDRLGEYRLIFVGLDDNAMRLVMLDNRIPKHSIILLTQRGAQYMRGTLQPLHDRFEEFKVIKPRMSSLLRGVASVPEEGAMLVDDFTLPVFRQDMGLESREAGEATDEDPAAWEVVLENGLRAHWGQSHVVYVYDPSSRESGYRGFRRSEVISLKEGDRVFVMSEELRERVEGVLRDAGVPISHDKPFELMFREYQDHVSQAVGKHFPAAQRADQARYLRSKILSSHPELRIGFPEEQSVRYWISHVDSRNKPFEELKTCAPREQMHFEAFGEALQMPPLMIKVYWQQVIMAIRNARRIDGRHVSDLYTYLLFQPEGAAVNMRLTQEVLRGLFEEARDNTYVIEALVPPAQERKSS